MATLAKLTAITSAKLVTGLVVAALATVSALAARAADSAPGSAPPVGLADSTGHGTGLPAHSGSGERVVYSVSEGRVWLVDKHGKVTRTYPVLAGSLAPSIGPHKVFARRVGGMGGDGVDVEHVILFAQTDGVNVGFSAAADGSLTPPDATKPTTAIRASRADEAVLWERATIDYVVRVVR